MPAGPDAPEFSVFLDIYRLPGIVPVSLVSPDLNADLRVDLSDWATFVMDWMTPGFDFRIDLVPDGVEDLADMMLDLQTRGCHNINVVTPTHYSPHIVKALDLAAADGLRAWMPSRSTKVIGILRSATSSASRPRRAPSQ